MRRNFALLFNQSAGAGRPRKLENVVAHLEKGGARVTHLKTVSAEDATRQVADIAKSGNFDAVIAAGGDGTIRAVAAGAAGTSMPVGIVPLGTGNVMRHEIGLSTRSSVIAQTLLEGPDIAVRGGLVNGAPFFLMAGAGFDGRIVALLNQRSKRVFGRLAYAAPVLKTLGAGVLELNVEVDSVPYNASWVIVTNAAHYGGSFHLTRDTQLGTGQLVAVIVTGKTRKDLLAASVALGLGRLANPKTRPQGIFAVPCNRVRITADFTVPVEVDGDVAGTTPIDISSAGPVVRLIVPAAYVADLTNRHTNHLPSGL
jgi:diacylglycerol kinase (ATP)